MDESQNGQVPVQGGDDAVDQPQATPTTDPTDGGGDDQGKELGGTEDPTVGAGTTAGDGGVTGDVEAPAGDDEEGDTV